MAIFRTMITLSIYMGTKCKAPRVNDVYKYENVNIIVIAFQLCHLAFFLASDIICNPQRRSNIKKGILAILYIFVML